MDVDTGTRHVKDPDASDPWGQQSPPQAGGLRGLAKQGLTACAESVQHRFLLTPHCLWPEACSLGRLTPLLPKLANPP